jgi:xanthine/CO dehydrogenase XdhC/CoxF family maturation factor
VDLGEVELHAPIGLPIGGDTPGEIAIGVLAEIIGKRHAVTRD